MNFNRNFNIFIQENAFESVVHEMAAIFSRPQCVNKTVTEDCSDLLNMIQWWIQQMH